MGNVISQAYERDCELVSMNRNKYFIVYFYHVRKKNLTHFQCGEIFFDSTSIFCRVNKIFEYFVMSFLVVVMAIKFNIAAT
jgi:hypothetical protein